MCPSAVNPSSNVPNGNQSKNSRAGSPFAGMPSKQALVTSFPTNLAQSSATSPSAPSLTTSPTNTSIQSSPEGPLGRNIPPLYSPAPFQLPESTLPMPKTPTQSTMGDAVTLNKGPGLMRRISRGAGGAANRFVRHRRSSNNVANRDHSSGPVTMRQRSESKSGADVDTGSADADLEEDEDELCEKVAPPTYGLGFLNEGNLADGAASLKKVPRTEGGIAPIVDPKLRKGVTMMKVTKKKKKNLTLVLDTNSAKVFWDPTRPSKRFYIDDIQEIRVQKHARNYREEFQIPPEWESRWFTIIYADIDRAKGRPVKTMHLIAATQQDFELWTSTLDDLQRYRRELMLGLAGSGQNERTLRGHWKREMAKLFGDKPSSEETEQLNLEGVESLCRSLHINCSKNLLRAQFSKADVNQTGFLDFEEFKDFVRRLKERPEIKEIYKTLTKDSPEGLDLNAFLEFLRDSQCIEIEFNRAHWKKVFIKFTRKDQANPIASENIDENYLRMTYAAFVAFLSTTYNNIQTIKPTDTKLDRPLNEYFISSSHNTYLLGRQFAGSSSTEAYVRALQRACRCVEIDCWDGPDGRPIVVHGRTMTTSVLFADCISVISKYAFVSSPYPLTLSLEVHCNPAQQQVMVDIMVRELGERLVTKPLLTDNSTLPSPEDLRYRILIKVKAGEDSRERDTGLNGPPHRRQRSSSSPFTRPQILDNTFIPKDSLYHSPQSMTPPDCSSPTFSFGKGSATATSMSSATDDSDTAQVGTLRPSQKKKRCRSKIIKTLGELGVYTRGLKFEDFVEPESKAYNHIFSLAERHFEGLCRDPDLKAQLEKHNMKYLMRVYPSAFRLKSSNPDPLAFWRRGTQMVALNWQTYDQGMQINEAMFASGSDRTGYVLKPMELRPALRHYEPTSEPASVGQAPTRKKLVRFSVDMISAQQIPQPRGVGIEENLDPYIEIEMFAAEDKGKGIAIGEGGQDASIRNGMSGIGLSLRRRTAVVQSNGYNPVFKEKFKLSVETKYPGLVFVRWTVWNSLGGRNYNNSANADPLATFTAKLSSLEQGYRHLPLYDHNGDQFLFATLFCKIMKQEPMTIEREDPVAEKVGRFKQLGQAVFKRTLSTERKNSKDE